MELSKCSNHPKIWLNQKYLILNNLLFKFECCFEAGGIQISDEEDDKFIQSIIGQIPSNGKELNVESMEKWINENCPRLLEPLREKMQWIFYGRQVNINFTLIN